MTAPAGTPKKQGRFRKLLAARYSLRLHMSLILAATFFAGLLATKLLLMLKVDSMLIRYPVAVIFSYAAFFLFIRIWLIYISSSGATGRLTNSVIDSAEDLADLPLGLPSGASSGDLPIPSFRGGGGSFGGSGASGIFETEAGQVPGLSARAVASGGSDSIGSDIADSASETVSGFFDGDDAWVLIILGILLALFCGVGVYLVYQAPMILSEAAFQGILATSLIKHAKKMGDPDWMGSVLRATKYPFLAALLIAILAAAVAHHAVPQAVRMADVAAQLLAR